MKYTMRRPVVVLVTVYAVFCVGWIGLVQWFAPTIISQVYEGRGQSTLNWIFSNYSSNSAQHLLDRWATFAGAVPLAAILHLTLVLFIKHIRKHQALVCGIERFNPRVDAVLIIFSAAFLALTILSGVPFRSDYEQYLAEWTDVLAGRDPWNRAAASFNAYGPLFNVLAPLVWVSPLANKLLFAFSYLVYVIWLIRDFWPRQRLAAPSWRWVTFWLLNPFPWVEISYLGYFDTLVALACVAAVHARVGSKDVVSGLFIGLGVLLKYMPLVILPFLAFDEQRFRFRLFISCVACIALGLLASTLVWGTSTFTPLMFAATRPPWRSLYELLGSIHSPLHWFWEKPNVEWLEKPLLLTAEVVLFVWCMVRRPGPALAAILAVLIFLLFYRVSRNNYQIVPFSLISYWAVSEWERLRENPAPVILAAIYFAVLAMVESRILPRLWTHLLQ